MQKEYGYRSGQLLVVFDSTEAGDKQYQWLVTDHLGSTRMVVDKSGSLAGVKRTDYLPFGEEIPAGVGIRTASNGYLASQVRQKFGSKERDTETGLDFFEARYFSSAQGRFTSPDEFSGGPVELFAVMAAVNPTFYADLTRPQSLNKYQYCYNNPLRYTDSTGHEANETNPEPDPDPCCDPERVAAGAAIGAATGAVAGGIIGGAGGAVVGGVGGTLVAPGVGTVAAAVGGGQGGSAGGAVVGAAIGGVIGGGFAILHDFFFGPKPQPASPAVPQTPPAPAHYEEHTTNQTPSNVPIHQKGEARKKRDQGGEKGDARRRPQENLTIKTMRGPGLQGQSILPQGSPPGGTHVQIQVAGRHGLV